MANLSNVTSQILLIESDSSRATTLQTTLLDQPNYKITRTSSLAAAITHLQDTPLDAVLLDLDVISDLKVLSDLNVPSALDVLADLESPFDFEGSDIPGLTAVARILQAAPHALIIILCNSTDETLAQLAVQQGAAEYVIKDDLTHSWLPRVLDYLIQLKAVKDALRDSETRFRAMSDAAPLGILVSDADGQSVYANAAYLKIVGLSLNQVLGTHWSLAIHPQDRQRISAEWHSARSKHRPFKAEARFLQSDDSLLWTRLNVAPMDPENSALGSVHSIEDISDRKAMELILRSAEEALYAEQERVQVTLNSIGDAVLTTDLQSHVTYLNRVAEKMTGWRCEDALGRPLAKVFTVINADTRKAAPNLAQRAISQNQRISLATDSVLVRRDGKEAAIEDTASPIHDHSGQITGAVIVFHDVSESRAMALKMSHLAQHDFLTGLPNRYLLTERLSQAIGQARRHKKQVALLFLDLDFFKHINDSLGHGVGDQLLQEIALRLQAAVRTTDTVCRQGGDEFVILLSEIASPHAAAHVAETLRTAIAQPFDINAQQLHISLSIGISLYPQDGDNVDSLMQNADTAMYHAKETGRNNYQFFRADMNAQAVRRLFIETSLRRALSQREFLLHYQPQIDLLSGQMTGAEALVRWLDPQVGLRYPSQFVPIAEDSGLILPLGQWVLSEACRQAQAWNEAGLPMVPVTVNISALEFRRKDFLDAVAKILRETRIEPRFLELELTESVLMDDAESSTAVLNTLKDMGVSLAIDDFGTGYSSLSYLQRFPIDTLKIDRSFVRDLATNRGDATIVSAIIGMGRNLHQRVIAEGVETRVQLNFLQSQHCAEGQGFLFSKPLAVDDFTARLQKLSCQTPGLH